MEPSFYPAIGLLPQFPFRICIPTWGRNLPISSFLKENFLFGTVLMVVNLENKTVTMKIIYSEFYLLLAALFTFAFSVLFSLFYFFLN